MGFGPIDPGSNPGPRAIFIFNPAYPNFNRSILKVLKGKLPVDFQTGSLDNY